MDYFSLFFNKCNELTVSIATCKIIGRPRNWLKYLVNYKNQLYRDTVSYRDYTVFRYRYSVSAVSHITKYVSKSIANVAQESLLQKFGKFGKSSMIRWTNILQISTYNQRKLLAKLLIRQTFLNQMLKRINLPNFPAI